MKQPQITRSLFFIIRIWMLCSLVFSQLGLAFQPAQAASSVTGRWIQLSTSGLSTSLFATHAVYDETNNKLIAFFPSTSPLSEVWILSNANGLGGTPTWSKLTTSGTPPTGSGGSVSYDAVSNRLIVYGGCGGSCYPTVSSVHVLSNANGLGGAAAWSELAGPDLLQHQREAQVSAYSPVVNGLISFGGDQGLAGTTLNDLRVFSNANGLSSPSTWGTFAPTGAGGIPYERSSASAIYNSTSNILSVYAGRNYTLYDGTYHIVQYTDAWVLSNADGRSGASLTWTKLAPTGSIPPGRFAHTAVYDAANDRMLVYGGLDWNQGAQTNTPLGDVWQLTHPFGTGGAPAWTQITTSGAQAPGARSGHSAAFDSTHQRLIVLGGSNDSGASNNVWVLDLNPHTLTVTSAHGTVTKNPDQPVYYAGDVVQLSVSADAGWDFTGWGGDANGTDNPLSVTIDTDKTISALYTAQTRTISGNAGVGGAGIFYSGSASGNATADASTGAYSFSVPLNWTGTITPSKAGYSFSPASIQVTTPVTANLTGQDFTAQAQSQTFYVVSGMPASLVLGQADFNSAGAGVSSTGMNYPVSIAVDPASGKVFVTESANHRVLRFASFSTLTNGAAAEAVFGQPNFTTNSPATTATGMYYPSGVAMDAAGHLWVTDCYNNRIIRFDNAASKPSGAPADGVLGQPDFTTNTAAVTQNGMDYPSGIAIGADGRVWVADRYNHRVLRFDNAASLGNGANANAVLGQSDFTTKTVTATAQGGMNFPYNLAIDSAHDVLWVADSSNNRVLRFDGAASKPNGAAADGVLGQINFTSIASATSQAGMFTPFAVSVENSGRIWVADAANYRVLGFENARTLANGANADYVLGQVDFVSRGHSASASTLYTPHHVFFDHLNNVLWVPDTYNHRVLAFTSAAVPNQPPEITEGATAIVPMSVNGSPTAFDLTLHATDANVGDTLTWSISSPASNGTASASGTGSSKVIGYTPNQDYKGPDAFTVQVADGNGGSDIIDVTVNVLAYHAPIAVAFIADNKVTGFHWPVGKPVALTITGTGPTYTETATSVANGTDPWDPTSTIVEFQLTGFTILPGQVISMSDGTTTKTHTITPLALSGGSASSDTIWGTSGPGAVIEVVKQTDHTVFRRVTADGAGNWLADFSAVGDEPGENIYNILTDDVMMVLENDADWDHTQLDWHSPHPNIDVWFKDGLINAYDWPRGTHLTLTIEDSSTIVSPDYNTETDVTDTSSQTLTAFRLNGAFDIKPGMTVSVSGASLSKSLLVSNLTITGIDLANDVISGGTEPNMPIWMFMSSALGPCCRGGYQADGNGVWTIDYSVPGPNGEPVEDIKAGAQGTVNARDNDGDNTSLSWIVPNPQFFVRANDDQIETWDWPLGSTLTANVYASGAETAPADYTATTTVNGQAPWDPRNYATIDLFGKFDLQPGQLVTVSDGISKKSTLITPLAFTSMDLAGDLVHGAATPGANVDTWACDNTGCQNRHVTASGAGLWIADFAHPGTAPDEQNTLDLRGDVWVDSVENDADGDGTMFGKSIPSPSVDVWFMDNKIDAYNWPIGTLLTLTINDPATLASPDYTQQATVTSTTPGNPNQTMLEFNLSGQFTIQPGMAITVSGASMSKSLVVAYLSITSINLLTDTITGQAGSNQSLWMFLGPDHSCCRTFQADAGGLWSVNYSVPGPAGEPVEDINTSTHGIVNVRDGDGDNTSLAWSAPQGPAAFGKTSPAVSAVGVSIAPTLVWETSAGAVSYEYCIDLTTNATCESGVWVSVGTNTSASLSGLLPGTLYSWQVQAINPAGTTYADGGTWHSFTTQPIISGNAGIAGAVLSYIDGTAKMITADASGNYSFLVPQGWTGRVTPSKAGYRFNPTYRDYLTPITTNQAAQNYIATWIPVELIKNGGFNTYSGTSKIPTYWTAVKFGTTDGKNITRKEGTAAVLIVGKSGLIKTLSQTILRNGGRESFTLSFWAKGSSIPVAGLCNAQVFFYNGAVLAGSKTVNCKTGTYSWVQTRTTIAAPLAYTKIVVKFTYSKASGSIWLDLFSLK